MNTTLPVRLSGTDVLMWANEHEVEHAAQNQLRRIAALPWLHGIRVMPDVHLGKGATVGSVIAMRQAVAPAAVGVDIGCGMIAVQTSLRASDLPDDLGPLRNAIERAIPVGFAMHKTPAEGAGQNVATDWDAFWGHVDDLPGQLPSEARRALHQMGTLGGGNHFIEVTVAQDDSVWLMLHSGSRGIGNLIAQYHIEKAKHLPHNADLPDKDLSVFLSGTPLMDNYRRDLYWAQDYAWRNRAVMMELLKLAVCQELSGHDVTFGDVVQCHHNYVSEETYDGVDVIVTRKGAIAAHKGALGLIPGSMGTGSYVVRGLGNPASYCSASHGAGRTMSRNAAKRRFSVADLVEQTKGVECRKDAGVLDEIPGAYKNLDSVMEAQSDLVEIVTKLDTVLCVKG